MAKLREAGFPSAKLAAVTYAIEALISAGIAPTTIEAKIVRKRGPAGCFERWDWPGSSTAGRRFGSGPCR